MRNIIIITVTYFLFIGCNKKIEKEISFDSFDFSYTGTFTESFSIKFTQNDSVYIRQHWTSNDINDSITEPKSNVDYVALLNKKERKELINYISKINFQKFDSTYYEDYTDGDYYKLNIKKGNLNKTISVHSYQDPTELDSLSNWIVRIKENLKLKRNNKKVNFKSVKNFLPPEPSPTLAKITE